MDVVILAALEREREREREREQKQDYWPDKNEEEEEEDGQAILKMYLSRQNCAEVLVAERRGEFQSERDSFPIQYKTDFTV